jgi:hypothetical protein
MRKRTALLLMSLLPLVTGAIGVPAFATAPPSNGTPTGLSAYGSVVIGTSFVIGETPPIGGYHVFLGVFSSQGPFYVEKVQVGEEVSTGSIAPLLLGGVSYDGLVLAFTRPNTGTNCPTIIPTSSLPMFSGIYGYGEIISVTPFGNTMRDPSGATAISGAQAVIFDLIYSSCLASHLLQFPTGLTLSFEATVLAPTAATVSICDVNGVLATACPSLGG